LCIFEFVYFARPDSTLYGRACTERAFVWASCSPIRLRLSPIWSWACPNRASPPPKASPGAAAIPFGQGLVKNRYIGRTFIAPTQELRSLGVRMKLNPLRDTLEGRRVVVVDDSIVRGTTTRQMVGMLREAGASKYTCGCRRRRIDGRVSTGWTPARG
jgi:amidophosphoribosyltransferase